MQKIFTERFAVYSMLAILCLVVLFHLLVVFGVIPYRVIWGGRLESSAQMLRFEAVSITLNLLMLAAVLIKAGKLRVNVKPTVIRIVFWVMFILFFTNTIGNLLSKNDFEKIVFTPLTLILSLLSFRLATSKTYKAT